MKAIRDFRLQLGLTQARFAGLLGINNGQLSMAESGKRALPPKARVVLQQMQVLLDTAEDPGLNPGTGAKLKADLEKLIRTKEREKRGVLLQIEKAEEEYGATLGLLTLMAMPEMEILLPSGTEPGDHRVLILRKAGKKNTQLALKLIQLKINLSALEAGLEKARSEIIYFFPGWIQYEGRRAVI